MYLKRIELLGFKSFVGKTEFVFGSGITSIVGPNGCGKSNVVDAFKWIFGEQSAKGLRGSEMKDVIFNGTQSRKPAGFCEVTVVFENSDRFFDVEFGEVAFTRRLFRSGESEYLINRQRSRLRDIKDLLMGTGIGASSYSIFEQGKIDVLLQASPQDRRIIFEEAAGISKYRARKAETLRALERVEDNLARLGDVISELEKRLRRVKIQASKARRFREYSDQLRDFRIRLAVDDLRVSLPQRADLTFRLYLLDAEIGRLERRADGLRRALETYSAERAAKGAELSEVRQRFTAIRGRRERLEESREHNRRRLDELGAERQRKHADLEATQESIRDGRDDLDRERSDLRELQVDVELRRSSLSSQLERLENLRREHDDLRTASEDIKQRIVERMEERSRLANQVVQLDSELGSLEGRSTRLGNELESARQELAGVVANEEVQVAELDARRQECARLDAEKSGAQDALARLDEELAELQSRLHGTQAEVQGFSSRLEVLESFEENLEGVSQGVAELLRERRGQSGVHDLVARLVEVDTAFAPALEAALGQLTQALVVESEAGALVLLDAARSSGSGAVEVIALDRVSSSTPAGPLTPASGVLGFLRDWVRAPERFDELLDRLLEGVVLVEDFDTALELSRNGLSHPFRLVTMAGELVEPTGALAIPGETTTGLISRRSEMQDLERQLVELRARAGRQREALEELRTRRSEHEAELQRLSAEKEELSRRVAAVESELEQVRKDRERLRRVVQVAESEIAEIVEETEERRRQREELSRRVTAVEADHAALAEESRRLEERLEEHGREVHAAAESVTEAKVALAEGLKREEGLAKSVRQLEATLADREARAAALREEVEDLEGRLESTERALEEAATSLEAIREQETECGAQLSSAEEEDRRLAEIEDALHDEIDRLGDHQKGRIAERGQLHLEDQEDVLRRQSALDKIADEYGIDLVAMLAEFGDGPAGGEVTAAAAPPEPVAGESVPATMPATILGEVTGDGATGETESAPPLEVQTAGSPSSDHDALRDKLRSWLEDGSTDSADKPGSDVDGDASWDRAVAATEARELQERIRRLGNINMEALEELDEIDERLRFQVTQRDDLFKAQRDLRQIIQEINKTSRSRFTETFEEVQRNFGDLFQKCFGGGKAELVLEDGLDVLESGIDIVARPPGKKLTNLSLMSGGEKTMTTIALMFAIFRARPSPLCVLDEVDAPLDETNVSRFVVLVKDFLENSQFVIVTHNKITMAVADHLYGVTMQERGVSKRVAVEFEKYDPENPHASLTTADIDAAPIQD